MNKNPILITGAMGIELDFLISKLENKHLKKEKIYDIYEGTINNYPVVILKTKVGIIHAAVSTTIILNKYNPIAIINQGTAGSHEKNKHRYDLIVGKDVININSVKTGIKQEGEGCNPLEWKIEEFHPEVKQEFYTYSTDKNLLEIANSIKDNYQKGNVYFGRIGSGDFWNREIDRINWFNKNLKTSCEEMEAVSIYKIADMFEIPVIAFKVVSNNEILGEEFDIGTAKACQEFVYMYIKEYINTLN